MKYFIFYPGINDKSVNVVSFANTDKFFSAVFPRHYFLMVIKTGDERYLATDVFHQILAIFALRIRENHKFIYPES